MNPPDPITRLNAALEGRYRIERELGEGGMATVFLAKDLKHNRNVALKVLKPELAAVVGAERFLAEIETTANLQHPHILPLFDSGEADSFLFYVMPYVEGEDLRERLDREHQLPVDDAVRIATNMAEALDYAHRQGVVHRDIKPANVLLLDGKPVIADFGIALAVGVAGGGRLTETGLSLGTPYYMSPEQASADRDPGPASDIYSLGCVLYEMLVGDPPYTGRSAQAVLAKILTEEARSVTEYRRTVPSHVGAAVTRALERLPADRFDSAGDFSKALDDTGFTHATATQTPGEPAAAPTPVGAGWRGAVAFAIPALVSGALLGYVLKPAPPAPAKDTVRFAITGDSVHSFVTICCGSSMALSPDGTLLAYQGMSEGVWSLWLRSLAQTTATRVTGVENPSQLFFSFDGDWIGYLDPVAQELKKVRVSGGAPATILRGLARPSGATWLADNTVVYGVQELGSGLMQVSADGGEPREITAVDIEAQEGMHAYPHALPSGRGLLFQVTRQGVSDRFIDFLDLESGDRRRVAQGTHPQYAGDEESGHVLFVAPNGAVMAQAMDPRSGVMSGEPYQVEDRIILRPDGLGEYGVSRTGTLIARSGEGVGLELSWVDRSGVGRPLGPVGDLRGPSFSPDGSRVAYESQGDLTGTEDEIWIVGIDPPRPAQRLTFEGDNSFPTWRPDGATVLFDRDGPGAGSTGVFERPSDFSGAAQRISEINAWEARYTPSAEWIVGSTGLGAQDLWVHDVSSGEDRPFLATEYVESTPIVSPSGAWIAYVSSESGRNEVYVQPFPEGGAIHLVSSAGGAEPLWSPDGRELLYRGTAGIVSVPVTQGGEWLPGIPQVLFEDVYEVITNALNWDISPDGQSFVMIDGRSTSHEITVTLNAVWPRE